MSKHILVTGGAGFVGSHLVDALVQLGHRVRILDNLTSQVHGGSPPEYLSPEAELVQGDIRDADVVRKALKDIEVIYHLAAAVGVGQSMYEISSYMGANTMGTAVLLQAMLDSKAPLEKLVVASSMSIYGEGKYLCSSCGVVAPPVRTQKQLAAKQWEPVCPTCSRSIAPVATDEGKPLQCSSIYALSKKDQEEMCLLYGSVYRIPVVALRYFNIFGSRQSLSNPYTGVAAIFASRLLNGKPPLLFEDGLQMRDFVSIHDVVQANLLALQTSSADGKALNIGSGHPISIREVALILASGLQRQVPAEITGKFRAGDIRHCFADITAAQNLLGYRPQHKFADGVADLTEWLRSQQPEDKAQKASAELESYGLVI